MNGPERIKSVQLFAWVGEDELGSGEVGLKQAWAPCGYTPLVGVDEAKIARFRPEMEAMAKQYGKKIYLGKFELTEILHRTPEGTEP
jgi:hypothetical protein